MAVLDSDVGVVDGSVSVADAVRMFRGLGPLVSVVDMAACTPADLVELTAGVRDGQRALDRLVMLIGAAAEDHAAQGRGRGAHGTLLGDGSRVRGRTARREADRARLVSGLPKFGAAVADGRIGGAQVDAVVLAARGLSDEQRRLLDSDELVEVAASLPVDVFARHVRLVVEGIKGDDGLGDSNDRRARSLWRHWFDESTGMGHVHGEFDPERYEAILGSVEAELTRLANQAGTGTKKDQRLAADAAFNLLTSATNAGGSGRPHVSVVVDWETFTNGSHPGSVRETVGGHPLAPESIARFACDADIQRIVLKAKSVPVDVGYRHRTATDAQWKAIKAVYRTCAWHGCDRPLDWCQLHHIHEWEHGGPTDLCNLIPVCSQHHHAVHEGGWTVKLDPDDRRLDIRTPDGDLYASTRPDRVTVAPVRGSPVAA